MTFPNTSKRALELSRQIAIGKRAAAVIPKVTETLREIEDEASPLVEWVKEFGPADDSRLCQALLEYLRALIDELEKVVE